MSKKNVYLFQINYTVRVAGTDSLWLPYSIACLTAYAKQQKDITDYFEFGPELFCAREDPEELIKRLDNPAVCGFSNYVWNTEWNLHMSKLVKEKFPECVIMFGGPNVWINMENEYEHIDVFLKLEGEFAFVDMLRLVRDGEPLPRTLSGERIHELNTLVDPYESGEFDWLVHNYPEKVWNAVYETNRGCPFLCTFCDWGGLTYSKVKKFEMERVENNWKWMSKNRVAYVLSADANVGIFKDRDIEIARIARKYADAPESIIDGINFQYNKNNTNVCLEIATILGPYSRGITFAVQSMSESVLEAIKRKNLQMNKLEHLLKEANKRNLYSYTELILPMPEETLDSWRDGLSKILELGQHYAISVWNTQILKNSEMNTPAYREEYGLDIIEAYDYTNYKNPNDWQGAPERIGLVRATKTMTLPETVNCWVYSILLREFHINGVTQMLSRYLFGKYGVRYREFYDRLFDILREHPITKDAIDFVTQVEEHYLTTGGVADIKTMDVTFDFPKLFGVPQSELPPGHFMKDLLNKFIFMNINLLREIAVKMVKEDLGYDLPDEVVTFNNAYMYNEDYEYPLKVTLDYNILEEEEKETTYTLEPKILKMDLKFKKKDPVMFYKQGAYKSNLTTESKGAVPMSESGYNREDGADTNEGRSKNDQAAPNNFGSVHGSPSGKGVASVQVHASSTTDHPTDIGFKSPSEAQLDIEYSNVLIHRDLEVYSD